MLYTILLVEDDVNTRERLSSAISAHSQLEVKLAASTFLQAREFIENNVVDVMLVDLGLPDGNGIDLIHLLQKCHKETEIMVITVFGDEKHVIAAIEAGATGYLLKDGSTETIGELVMQLIAGGSPISPSIARYLLKRFSPNKGVKKNVPNAQSNVIDDDVPSLTKRESEVLGLVVKGFMYAEIGTSLGVSVHTVTTHIKRIYRKLSVNSRGEAVFEAMQLGLIDPMK